MNEWHKLHLLHRYGIVCGAINICAAVFGEGHARYSGLAFLAVLFGLWAWDQTHPQGVEDKAPEPTPFMGHNSPAEVDLEAERMEGEGGPPCGKGRGDQGV